MTHTEEHEDWSEIMAENGRCEESASIGVVPFESELL
jgi:hypothetical protein